MRRIIILMLLAGTVVSCSDSNRKNKASESLTPSEADAVKKAIIRFVSKAPDGTSGNEKFDAKYNAYYEENAKRCFLEFYTVKDNYHYFLVTQPAASMVEKRHATGGRFALNDKGEVTEYEEIFRTWKMTPQDLRTKSEIIFNDMVAGESLERYYTKHAGDKYIEFPDDRTYYDKEARAWKVK